MRNLQKLKKRRKETIEFAAPLIGSGLDEKGLVERGWIHPDDSRAYQRGRAAAIDLAQDCPPDILLRGPSKRSLSVARQRERVLAHRIIAATSDRPLTPNATPVETHEDLLLRISIARAAGLIDPAQANKMTASTRRRLRRLRHKRVN